MFSVRRRILICAFGFLVVLSLVLTPGLTPVNVPGSITSADPNIPRSYVEFIDGAYVGALGRFPTCFEEQAEYDSLASAAAVGGLHEEAERFVSTLFETQASYNVPDIYTYCQSSEYEAINPAFCNPFINTRSEEFLTAQYRAFLLREPDPDGFNFWLSTVPGDGRKHLILAFADSIEFSVLVDNLYAGTRPVCTIECPECNPDPCEGPNTDGHYSKLCP
jgi:uncharacterized protein DUF4214